MSCDFAIATHRIVFGSPQGTPPFHRIAEIYFPSMKALQACAASDGGKQTLANAVAISSGGAPIFRVAEEEVFVFQGK
ncbi:MAG TPA: EthD domain-containing protein [Candidatus Sulfotelmatobacter sp.]